MSKLKRRKQAAARRGVFAFRAYDESDYRECAKVKHWDVYVDSEWIMGPRGLILTKRQAIALAYRIAISKHTKLEV